METQPQSLSQLRSVVGPAGAELRWRTENKERGQSQAVLWLKLQVPGVELVRGRGAIDVG